MSNRTRYAATLLGPVVLALLCASALNGQTMCNAEIQFTNPKPLVGGRVTLNLFSTVGSGCSAEIRLMAAFYDDDQNVVCTGVIDSVAPQNGNIQSSNLDLRPLVMSEFVRLRAPHNPPPRRLFCLNPDTGVEVGSAEMMRVTSLRLRAIILTTGNVATAEVRFNF